MGLDLSLRRSAVCFIPGDWEVFVHGEVNWGALKTMTVGQDLKKDSSPEEKADRLVKIAGSISEWISETSVVFVEDYAYGMAGQSGMMLGELGGAVKYALRYDVKLGVRPVNQSTARKFLLGKLPQKDRAAVVVAQLEEWGCPFATSDEKDAFTIANYGRTELGMPGLTLGGNDVAAPTSGREKQTR